MSSSGTALCSWASRTACSVRRRGPVCVVCAAAATAAAIVDARAWLSTTIMRICIDRLKSARARRETYPGTWLPEPVLTTAPPDFESIQLGFLVLLERLDPKEIGRAA